MDRLKTLIFIPALNEADTIQQVISGCLSISDVLVLDDGSTDSTSLKAKAAGALVIKNDRPQGYDKAVYTGFKYALNHGFDILITADADGQHRTTDIKAVLSDAILYPEAALVIGCRSTYNRLAEYVFSATSRLIFRISDPLTGLKAYRIQKLAPLVDDVGKNAGSKIVVATLLSNRIIWQSKIIVEPRQSGVSRYGSSIVGELKIIKMMCSFFLYAAQFLIKKNLRL